ncbi:hypothetical protein GOBAR_DD19523 [Gossypium barbadense]|nr:hypothetical protein GOBAR_DD19523 [Gossypium barbadense]
MTTSKKISLAKDEQDSLELLASFGVNSPRFLGSMTHRAQLLKHNNNSNSQTGTDNNVVGLSNDKNNNSKDNNLSVHHKIDLQSNSPKLEVGVVGLVLIEGLSQKNTYIFF